MTERPARARLARFIEHERRHRLNGRHRAVNALHRRAGRPAAGARLVQYLRIERGVTA